MKFDLGFEKAGFKYHHTHEDGDAMYNELVNSVDACVAVGAPIVVVHLSSGQNPPPTTDAGRGRYIQLVDYAAKKNIKIAFENQRMLGNIGWAFEPFPDENAFAGIADMSPALREA